MRSLGSRVIICSAAALMLWLSPAMPALAQSGGETSGLTPICLVNANSQSDAVIVVSAADVPALEAKGFEVVNCANSFGSETSLQSYRDAICTIASIPDKATQDLYEEQFGERPAVLCGMAERALGQWKRKGES